MSRRPLAGACLLVALVGLSALAVPALPSCAEDVFKKGEWDKPETGGPADYLLSVGTGPGFTMRGLVSWPGALFKEWLSAHD